MSRFRLPGSSLLDRCIGRSTFEYVHAINITNPFKYDLSYDSYIKALSKYKPTKYNNSWTFITPFGRETTCRINIGSSRRTVSVKNEKEKDEQHDPDSPTNMELYEFCVGSIRNSIFTIQSISLLPPKMEQFLIEQQYKAACYWSEKRPGSILDAFFSSLYRVKAMNEHSFTSTPPNIFPKWCSSITLVRVLKEQNIDTMELIDKLDKEENINHNDDGLKLKGKSNVNLSKDIDHDLKQENKQNYEEMEFPMKSEYQSDFMRHFEQLTKFENNYQCNEMYLVLSTRYVLLSNSTIWKLLFFPHWYSVKILSHWRYKKILNDLSEYLRFIAETDSKQDQEHPLHKDRPRKRKKNEQE